MSIAVSQDRTIAVPLTAVVGSFRTFGRLGPVYEVLALVEDTAATDPMLRIRVVESGEQLDYPLSSALEDPRAA